MRRVVYLAALLSAAVVPAAVVRAQDARSAGQSVPLAPATDQTPAANGGPAVNDAIVKLPLTGPAFILASEAEKAYASGDYATALAKLREAIRQRPDAVRLRGLLIMALEASGQTEEARKETEGLSQFDKGSSPSADVVQVRAELAQYVAKAAFQALEKGKTDDAIKGARKAAEMAPDEDIYQLLLAKTLVQVGDLKGVEAAANNMLDNDSENAGALVLRAYIRQRQGSTGLAAQDLDQAMKADWLSKSDQRSVRLIAVDAAIASGDAGRARAILDGMDKSIPSVAARLILLGTATRPEPMRAPPIQCQETRYGLYCQILLEGGVQSVRESASLAYDAAVAAYKAFASNDFALAEAKAREAVRLNPEDSSYRLLLIRFLLRQNNFTGAVTAANEAFAADGEDVNSLVMRAYARQRMGDIATANADFDAALKVDWLSDADMRSIRLIAIDGAIAAHDFSRATALMDGMDKNADDVKKRLQRVAAGIGKGGKSGDSPFATPVADCHTTPKPVPACPAASMPAVDCHATPYGQSCSISPGDPASPGGLAPVQNPGYEAASRAYKAAAGHDYALAIANAREAARLSPGNAAYKALLANLLASQKASPNGTAGSTPDRGYDELRQIGALVDENRQKDAREVYNRALSSGKLKSLAPLDLAYLAVRVEDKATAYKQFGVARTEGKLHGLQLVDAAYAARRVYDNELAVALLKQAIDEIGDTLEPQQLFNLRREISTLSRTWGAYLSFSHGSTTAMPGGPISDYVVDQMGSEIYWRPPGIGYRDGATFELFARNFLTLHDESGGPTGFPTAQASAGARWKPFRQYNLVFEVARLFRLSEYSRDDTMLRLAWSDGAGGDLRQDVSSWWMWSAYGEVGRYLETKQTFGTFDVRGGRSYRADAIDDHLVVTPFIGLGGSFDSLMEDKLAVGAGPGLNLRWWFREDKYTAPMSYVDLNVQYKFKLSGDDRAKGLFANLTVSY